LTGEAETGNRKSEIGADEAPSPRKAAAKKTAVKAKAAPKAEKKSASVKKPAAKKAAKKKEK
jgi:hypothetical protein